jgi:hypothetical protein
LYLPRVIMMMENLVEWRLAGETEVLGENLSTTNPTWPDPALNRGRRGGKLVTNHLSYGAAYYVFKPSLLSSLDGSESLLS